MTSSARNSVDKSDQHDESDATTVPTSSSPQSLSQAVHARRAEFTRPHSVKVKIGTWNVAACPGTEKDVGGWFVDGKGIDERLAGLEVAEGIRQDGSQKDIESVEGQESRRQRKSSTLPLNDKGTILGGDDIGLYVLGLQEVVELSSAREYIGKFYSDDSINTKWLAAVTAAMPRGYRLVLDKQLSGLLLLIFASPEIAPTISSISTVTVGTGVMGYLGNKGSVATRVVLGETTRLVFINSHLASGTDQAHVDRRCWDVQQILQRTRFDPISRGGVMDDLHEEIGDEDFAFWFGDLNFRLEGLPAEDVRRILMLHTRGEYATTQTSSKKIDEELATSDSPIVLKAADSDEDSIGSATKGSLDMIDESQPLPDPDDFVEDPHTDPQSLQATLDSLLPHDQLRRVQRERKAFHDGWREGPITFLPTYKYDVGSMGMFDSSEKKRGPSWCDRILYRSRRDKMEYDGKSQEQELARLKDEEMKARGIDHAADDDSVLFEYDPDADGTDADGADADDGGGGGVGAGYDETKDHHRDDEAVVTRDGFIDRVHLDVYTSHQRVLSSDHKPLDAIFTLDYDAVVPELKAKVQQEIARELDRAENEGRPGITVVVDHHHEGHDGTTEDASAETMSMNGVEGVDFGAVRYLIRKTRGLTIANTSRVPATFSFVEKPAGDGEADAIAPSWLTVRFSDAELDEDERVREGLERQMTLEPGEAVNANIEVYVKDVSLVRKLNARGTQLDDVLVLRVTDGRDHFVPIHGTWQQSCFGRSIDELIRIPEGGVRALVPARHGTGMVNRGQEVRWSAPRELFKLTEAVENLVVRVMADWHMSAANEGLSVPWDANIGWPFDRSTWLLTDKTRREGLRAYVLDALDADKKLGECFPAEVPSIERLEITVEVLVGFLASLSDGVITAPLWHTLEGDIVARDNARQVLSPEEQRTWVLDVLSAAPNHNIALVFLTSMLSRVAQEVAPLSATATHSSSSVSTAPPAASSLRGSLDIRRSLSFKGRSPLSSPPPLLPPPAGASDPATTRRKAVDRRFADVFADVLFRGSAAASEKDKKVVAERRTGIVEVFLQGSGENF